MAAALPANPKPCAACPWRLENQGTPHPHGWYTKKNLAFLWSRLRRGEAMSCHPTDPGNPVPEGWKVVPADRVPHECAGALVLMQREVMNFSAIVKADPERSDALQVYRRLHSKGLTRDGLAEIVSREAFRGVPLLGGVDMTKPNLNDVEMGYPPLGIWEVRQ